MTDLLLIMKNPPESIEDVYAWKTPWNETYVTNRQQAASAAREDAETGIITAVTALRTSGMIAPSTTVQDLVRADAPDTVVDGIYLHSEHRQHSHRHLWRKWGAIACVED